MERAQFLEQRGLETWAKENNDKLDAIEKSILSLGQNGLEHKNANDALSTTMVTEQILELQKRQTSLMEKGIGLLKEVRAAKREPKWLPQSRLFRSDLFNTALQLQQKPTGRKPSLKSRRLLAHLLTKEDA